MIKNVRAALICSLVLGGCAVDDPAMFDTCKTSRDCSGTIVVSDCRQISVSYDGDVATESFCTANCSTAGASCNVVSYNGQLAYCAGLTASGAFTTGSYASAVCIERCYSDNDCTPGFICVDSKFVDVDRGVAVCVPGETVVIPLTDPYDFCDSSSECNSASPVCMDVAAKWDGETTTYTASICSDTCTLDTDCPNITIGGVTYAGTCMPAGVLGSTSVCAQGCSINSDCIQDFDCADADELVGVDPDYDICAPHIPK